MKYSKYSISLKKRYHDMISRCYNPNDIGYKNYGGKGVRVCREWIDDKILFFEWALANGYKDNLQLDKDIKGDGLLYSPDTCCWVTCKENMRAKRGLKRYFYEGKNIILSEIAELTGINIKVLHQRITKGASLEEAIDKTGYDKFISEIKKTRFNIPDMATDEYRAKAEDAKKIIQEIISYKVIYDNHS